jgi:hypothetical protein
MFRHGRDHLAGCAGKGRTHCVADPSRVDRGRAWRNQSGAFKSRVASDREPRTPSRCERQAEHATGDRAPHSVRRRQRSCAPAVLPGGFAPSRRMINARAAFPCAEVVRSGRSGKRLPGEGKGFGEREEGTVPFPHGRMFEGGACPSFMGRARGGQRPLFASKAAGRTGGLCSRLNGKATSGRSRLSPDDVIRPALRPRRPDRWCRY